MHRPERAVDVQPERIFVSSMQTHPQTGLRLSITVEAYRGSNSWESIQKLTENIKHCGDESEPNNAEQHWTGCIDEYLAYLLAFISACFHFQSSLITIFTAYDCCHLLQQFGLQAEWKKNCPLAVFACFAVSQKLRNKKCTVQKKLKLHCGVQCNKTIHAVS